MTNFITFIFLLFIINKKNISQALLLLTQVFKMPMIALLPTLIECGLLVEGGGDGASATDSPAWWRSSCQASPATPAPPTT